MKKVIIASCFGAFFIAALVVATFYDLEISRHIARLNGGNYLSNNLFGTIGEIFGESPVFLIGGVAACFIARGSLRFFSGSKLKGLCLAATFYALSVFAFSYGVERFFAYCADFAKTNELFSSFFWLVVLVSVVIGVGLAALSAFLTSKIPTEKVLSFAAWGLVVFFAVVISQLITHGIKPIFGRQRYRAIYVLEYVGRGDLVDYTKWFVVNGKRTVSSETLALGIASDAFKSFPSGHTCSAATTFALTSLPFFVVEDKEKSRRLTSVLTAAASAITLLVAFSRIVMGAHYLSDVLIGGAITFFAVIISENIVKALVKR